MFSFIVNSFNCTIHTEHLRQPQYRRQNSIGFWTDANASRLALFVNACMSWMRAFMRMSVNKTTGNKEIGTFHEGKIPNERTSFFHRISGKHHQIILYFYS